MAANRTHWRESVRIIWAITAKDLIEALKNKNTAFLILFGVLMLVFYREYPSFVSRSEKPTVLVYDAGNSALAAYLENSPALEVYTGYKSEAQMQEKLANGDVPELGLVIPADFDQTIEMGGTPVLQGYVMNWVNESQAVELQQTVQAEIRRLTDRQMAVQVQGKRVYPLPESGGIGVDAGFGFVYIIFMIGLVMIPHLMMEEKQSHTLEALLVSPASEGQIVMAKAFTGLFYCLVGAGIGLALFANLEVHWWLAVLSVAFGSLFAVSLGLLLGTMIDNRGQLTLFAWIFIIPLFLPVFLSLMDDLLPAVLIQIFRILPTVVMFNLLRASFSETLTLGTVWLQLAWVAAWAGAFLSVVAWLVHRRDRQAERGQAFWQSASERFAQAAETGLRRFPWLNQGLAQPRQAPAETISIPENISLPESNSLQENVSLPEIPHDQVSDLRLQPVGSLHSLGIIWAIAAKDIGAAIKNKLVLSILLGTVLVVLNGSVLPMLLGFRNLPIAIVYDEGRSTLVRALTGQKDFRLVVVDSQEEMQAAISGAPETRLGLVLPADFDQQAGRDGIIHLQGYLPHWADAEKAGQLVTLFEQVLGQASWETVQIDTDGHGLYPTVDTGGQLTLTTLMTAIVLLTLGMVLVPMLFIDEKEAHTFEALLVSPASLGQVLAGKALAGGFYCLVAAGVVLLLNRYLMVHWGVALLAVLLGTAFAVALGLVVGFLSDTPATTGMWGSLLLIGLLVLTGLQTIQGEDWPRLVQALLDWQPGSAMINLFRFSMVGEIPPGLLWANAAALFVAAGLVYAFVLGLLRRADR